MKYTQEQFDKLPNWVKNEIFVLRNQKESLEKRLSEFTGERQTNTYIRDGFEEQPIPNSANVIFKSGDRLQNSVSVYVQKDGIINFNSDSRSGKEMVIMPRASNSFYIAFVDVK